MILPEAFIQAASRKRNPKAYHSFGDLVPVRRFFPVASHKKRYEVVYVFLTGGLFLLCTYEKYILISDDKKLDKEYSALRQIGGRFL